MIVEVVITEHEHDMDLATYWVDSTWMGVSLRRLQWIKFVKVGSHQFRLWSTSFD